MDYIVSGHGGRWATPTHMVFPPDGFTVNFFVNDGEVMSNAAAWPIYNHLLAGDEASIASSIVKSVGEGGEAYNYSCWNYPQLANNCGVFKVGAVSTSNPVISLRGYTETNPLSLYQLFDMLPEPGRIYWVACQIAS